MVLYLWISLALNSAAAVYFVLTGRPFIGFMLAFCVGITAYILRHEACEHV